MDRLQGRLTLWFFKLLRTLAYLILVLLFIQQSLRSITLYRQDLRTTVTSMEGHSNTDPLTFPDIKLFPSFLSQRNNSNDTYATNEDGSSKFLSQFNEADLSEEFMVLAFEFDKYRILDGGVRFENGILTRCQVVHITDQFKAGFNKKLRIGIRVRNPVPNFFNAWVHSPFEAIPSWSNLFDSAGVEIDSAIKSEIGILNHLIPLTRELYKDLPDDSCRQAGQEEPLLICLHDYLANNVGCLVPWLNVSANFQQMRNCTEVSELEETLRLWDQILNVMDEDTVKATTGCKPPCNRFSYKVGSQTNSYWRDFLTKDPRYSVLMMEFSFTQPRYQVFEEVKQYPFGYLVGNIGGYLGLLLGFSAMDFVNKMYKRATRTALKEPKQKNCRRKKTNVSLKV